MKHKKNNRDTSYDIEFLKAICNGLNEKNQELECEVERLRNEIAETNDVNEDEKNYKNLVQLNTLLMVLMNLVAPHCDSSPLGQTVAKAIKKYQITMAKNLAKGTLFIREEDRKDWDDEDNEELNDEKYYEWNGEEY